MKVMTVVGTRPELIRLSRVMSRLDEETDHVLVHTGQNYDYKLRDVFFEELGLRTPDYSLGIDNSSLGVALGGILQRIEPVLRAQRPDAFLILGDTNSCISALMAKRMRIPVYHMEAGNRCFDENVPEETNRRMVDHIADFNLVYTEHARRNLLREGLEPRRVVLTGSPMREVLTWYLAGIDSSSVLRDVAVDAGGYLLASVHRQENVDSAARLRAIMVALAKLGRELAMPVLVSTHPRTRSRLDAAGLSAELADVRFLDPFGFLDYNHLQRRAFCVFSDSGTISEESYMLGFPAVTLRPSIERPEALEAGSIVLVDPISGDFSGALALARAPHRPASGIAEYEISNTSERVLRFMQSTYALSKVWSGLRTD